MAETRPPSKTISGTADFYSAQLAKPYQCAARLKVAVTPEFRLIETRSLIPILRSLAFETDVFGGTAGLTHLSVTRFCRAGDSYRHRCARSARRTRREKLPMGRRRSRVRGVWRYRSRIGGVVDRFPEEAQPERPRPAAFAAAFNFGLLGDGCGSCINLSGRCRLGGSAASSSGRAVRVIRARVIRSELCRVCAI